MHSKYYNKTMLGRQPAFVILRSHCGIVRLTASEVAIRIHQILGDLCSVLVTNMKDFYIWQTQICENLMTCLQYLLC